MTINSVLENYLLAYRDLISAEHTDESVTLSLPMHLAAGHRIEITVTDLGNGRCALSDAARTMGEVEAAGFTFTKQMKERIERVAGTSGLRIVNSHLILECVYADLGFSIQKFLEASKTIGDVYLVHRYREKADAEIITQVRHVFDSMGILYRLDDKIQGRIEKHPFDLVVPRNGRPGMALGVLGGQNTHNLASTWYYRCDDVKKGEWYRQGASIIAIVYDVRNHVWSEASREILESTADIAVPSDSVSELGVKLA